MCFVNTHDLCFVQAFATADAAEEAHTANGDGVRVAQ